MQLSRKQVKAFLDVMSSDTTRPALTEAKINLVNELVYLTATDGYTLAALQLDDSLNELVGKVVTREELTKWYKLATNKEYFTDDTVREIASDSANNFPQWEQLIPGEDKTEDQTGFTVNAPYLLTMQILADCPLYYTFYGKYAPLVARNGGSIYLVMPLKK